jgi:hypothetical protein|tara:strand:- start:477 stop:644 length:168 start_codon:yes stop_codon:yes gene_type:complete
MREKYVLVCPECSTEFDCKSEMVRWHEEILVAEKFMEKVQELNSQNTGKMKREDS